MYCRLRISASSEKEANTISRALVQKKLVAGTMIYGGNSHICPIVAFNEIDGNGDFLGWIDESVVKNQSRGSSNKTNQGMRCREEDEILKIVARGEREYRQRKTVRVSSMKKLRSK